jgi:hypothetical protein
MGEPNNVPPALTRWPALVALRWNRPTKLVCALVAMAAYLLVAHWLKLSYVPPVISKIEPKVAGTKSLLRRPFVRFLNSDFGVIAKDTIFAGLADSVDNNQRSPIEIYEDDRRVGPAHSSHADVAKIGRGRFSHWRNDGVIFVFSSSDNSDPQTNGRAYWAVRPDISESRSDP